MSTATIQTKVPQPTATKPPRKNCAGYCEFCAELECESPHCVAVWERSTWMVCPTCDGFEQLPNLDSCGCIWGVIESTPITI